ncbi:hypothetical protein ABZ820_34670 [Streptomyces diacarni]|uniref:hypothetical protein n=1 Tax=Streptomyces diacarni TaxID=2800381 RepID=UPI00340B0EC6
MQHPFRHPLATHSARDVLGWRRNGAPIYAIAGGSSEGDDAGGNPPAADNGQASGQPSGQDGQPAGQATTPPAGTGSDQGGQQSGQGSETSGDATDWKALARQWEKRAKENRGAADELATLKQQAMTDQEKAVAEAEKRGRTAASVEHGQALAQARFEAAAAQSGVQLGDAADLIDTSQFVAKDGSVDGDAIKAAVKKLSKLAPRGAGRSGADITGGSGDQPSVDAQIADAKAKGNWRQVLRLENSKLTNQ